MAPSCWFFWALWLPLVLTVAAAEERVEDCSDSAKRCGNMSISDPFWLRDIEVQRACGLSDFEVTCVNNTVPCLWSSMPLSFGFAIMDINYEEQSLRVADGGKLFLLHAGNSCGIPIWNTSAKLGVPFSISAGSLNLILYNCTEEGAAAAAARRDRELGQTRMRCGNESAVFVLAGGRHNETSGGYGGYAGCDSAVTPVLGAYGEAKANASQYEQLIDGGFILTWELPPPRKFTRQIMSCTCTST